MNSIIQISIFFQLIISIRTFLYPCEYLQKPDRILKCDLCQCLNLTSSNFCSSIKSIDCRNTNSNEEFLRWKIDQISNEMISSENQIEFHHFNTDILNQEELCLMKNSSQLTFFNLTLKSLSKCLINMHTLRFVNSFIKIDSFFSENLVFYNSTLNINSLKINLTKILILHSIEFSHKSFELHSLSSLTHLTITFTEYFHLTGFFSNLIYLNLCSTKLTDKKLTKLFSDLTLPDLTTLILSNNRLTMLTNKFPSTIRYLDLSHNQIKSLDYYSFKSLYSLNFLNLSFNSPLEIQQDTFTRIPYLEILDLTSTLPTLAFEDLFLPLQKLRYLNISGNILDILPPLPIPYDAHLIEMYDHDLPVLYVDLSHNQFEKLDFDLLTSSSLQDRYILSLNFQSNHLQSLSLNETKKRGPFIELNINDNPLKCDCEFYRIISNLFSNPSNFRLKFLHLSNLTCFDMLNLTHQQYLFELNSSNIFCSYTNSCPIECSCQHSFDLKSNHVNCSYRQLKTIPSNLPSTTTHLYLNNNQIKSIESNFTLNKNQFLTYFDLSSNQIEHIHSNTFNRLLSLEKLFLHNNSWLPNLTNNLREFQLNKHLLLLTYANGLLCNRTDNVEQRTLTMQDCCQSSINPFCSQIIDENNRITNTTNFFFVLINDKYFLLSLIVFLLLLIILLISFIYLKKRLLFSKEQNYLSNSTVYNQQKHDHSISYTDEDDYASIPLTISQTDLSPVIHIPVRAPPLPPPRYFFPNRPISNSSTTSTSITIPSQKLPNSCLQIKLDVLVLYSINDSEYIHEKLGRQLELMYGKRFSFYFIHRDRMLGELDWLIENSCITLLVLSKPYYFNSDYMKVFSKYPSIKCFILLISSQENHSNISIKIREKIARLYPTSDIYEWNSNPNSLIHEQLELYLEQNCGTATYVTN